MNETFLRLGRAIAGRCPPGFASAQLSAEIDEGRIALLISCSPSEGGTLAIDPAPVADEIIHCLGLIREDMAADGSAPWRSCMVTLRKGGHFSIDVSAGPLPKPGAQNLEIKLGE